MVRNAFTRGRRREDFKGPLRKYLDRVSDNSVQQRAADTVIVYGDYVFFYASKMLVTMWKLPERYREMLAVKSHKPKWENDHEEIRV